MSLSKASWAYKILTDAQWQVTKRQTMVALGENDHADGFVHLSFKDQVPSTLQKYFAQHRSLWLLRFSTSHLGDGLRIEKSRNDEPFPHYYGDLLVSLCDTHYFIPDDTVLREQFLRGLA